MKADISKNKSYRQQKAATLIHGALVEVLRQGKMLDKRLIDCPITITRVLVTADLRLANCYFIPFNTSLKQEELAESLNNSRYIIRHFVTSKIKLKYSPEIRFHYDCGFENSDTVEQLLNKLAPPSSHKDT